MSNNRDKIRTVSFHASNKPHDLLFKRTFAEFPAVAKELMQVHLPEQLINSINLDNFELCNHEMFSPTSAARVADVVVKTSIKQSGEDAYLVFFVFEHQSSNDPLIAFRILQYIVRRSEEHTS